MEPRSAEPGWLFCCLHSVWKNGRPSGKYEVFAENFAGVAEQAKPGDTANAGKLELASPGDAKARPMGLAQGPDGSLYITDSVKARCGV
jgi:glucose/arabinose dehydrogenase